MHTLDNNGVLDGGHCDRFGGLKKRKDCCRDVGLVMKRMMRKKRSSGGFRGWYLYLKNRDNGAEYSRLMIALGRTLNNPRGEGTMRRIGIDSIQCSLMQFWVSFESQNAQIWYCPLTCGVRFILFLAL